MGDARDGAVSVSSGSWGGPVPRPSQAPAPAQAPSVLPVQRVEPRPTGAATIHTDSVSMELVGLVGAVSPAAYWSFVAGAAIACAVLCVTARRHPGAWCSATA